MSSAAEAAQARKTDIIEADSSFIKRFLLTDAEIVRILPPTRAKEFYYIENPMAIFSADQILAEEAFHIHRQNLCKDTNIAREIRENPDKFKKTVGGFELTAPDKQVFHNELNGLNRSALCLSGGGIRSAAFSLGVIQAFAACSGSSANHAGPAGGGSIGAQAEPQGSDVRAKQAGASLLTQFHYLSTVSGGGYCGSFLSAWRSRCDFSEIWSALVGRSRASEGEAKPLAWLRTYSNYLSPKVGLMSADTWAGAAIAGRNLLLNWLVIVSTLCVGILALKLLSVASIGLAHLQLYTASKPSAESELTSAVFCALPALAASCLGYALFYATKHRPSWQPRPDPPTRAKTAEQDEVDNVRQSRVIINYLMPSVLSAVAMTQVSASSHGLHWLEPFGFGRVLPAFAAAGFSVFAGAWLLARIRASHRAAIKASDAANRIDFLAWAFSGAVYGAIAGLGACLYAEAPWDGPWLFNDLLLPLIFGVPWFLAAQMIAEMIFVGLSSREERSDEDREWFGRSAGWVLATLIGWMAMVFLTFAGSYVLEDIHRQLPIWLASVGGTTGLVTALVGGTSLSPAVGRKGGSWPFTTSTLLGIAAPLFGATLIIVLSGALDAVLLDAPLVRKLRDPGIAIGEAAWWAMMVPLAIGFLVTALLALGASWAININRFSLHAVYRNRLIRAFLGATNPSRRQDAFTGFDGADNLAMHELWQEEPGTPPSGENWRPFHVINMALNIVSTKRLAWQHRKAESFTVSPLHAGSACKAYRSSKEYGHPNRGISLGTAMAISGAAASPNMGYNSSPAVTFLLALFNVRLGWWLGNPGTEGNDTYRKDGPTLAVIPFLKEVFGLTTDEKPYIYLSDGGHFENLGLYEMVRRRCRTIVAVDAGADPNFVFEDVGNAVRKIELDLGVRVEFFGLEALATWKADGPDLSDRPYHAIANIHYREADRGGEDGVLLYIKPAYHGTEGAGIRSYAASEPTFPHQSTGDQFFSEPQFESYRALGFEIADGILSKAKAKAKAKAIANGSGAGAPTLSALLQAML